MQKRHLNNQQWPLTLQEILDELQIFDLSKRSLAFLQEALPNNPRLIMESEKFAFRPPYKIKGKTSLVAVARKHYQDGKGGILVSDLAECVANYDALLQVGIWIIYNKNKVFIFQKFQLKISKIDFKIISGLFFVVIKIWVCDELDLLEFLSIQQCVFFWFSNWNKLKIKYINSQKR